jgi:hypothetical protein
MPVKIKGIVPTIALLVWALMMPQDASLAEGRAVPPVVRDNALLKEIYRHNPAQALSLAAEVENELSSARVGNQNRQNAGSTRLKFRGEIPEDRPGLEDDAFRKNRKDFDENPLLRKMYFHSPLASLRMLKRLREAAGKGTKK